MTSPVTLLTGCLTPAYCLAWRHCHHPDRVSDTCLLPVNMSPITILTGCLTPAYCLSICHLSPSWQGVWHLPTAWHDVTYLPPDRVSDTCLLPVNMSPITLLTGCLTPAYCLAWSHLSPSLQAVGHLPPKSSDQLTTLSMRGCLMMGLKRWASTGPISDQHPVLHWAPRSLSRKVKTIWSMASVLFLILSLVLDSEWAVQRLRQWMGCVAAYTVKGLCRA